MRGFIKVTILMFLEFGRFSIPYAFVLGFFGPTSTSTAAAPTCVLLGAAKGTVSSLF
jgi:hypothetical protein